MSYLKLLRSLTAAVVGFVFLAQCLELLKRLLGGFHLPEALAFSGVLEPYLLAPFIHHCDITVIGSAE